MTMEEVGSDLDVGLEPKESEAEELEHTFWSIARMLGIAASLQRRHHRSHGRASKAQSVGCTGV